MSGRKRRRDEYGFFPSENQYTKCIQLYHKVNFPKHCNISIECKYSNMKQTSEFHNQPLNKRFDVNVYKPRRDNLVQLLDLRVWILDLFCI
jgi:hypothetical protein